MKNTYAKLLLLFCLMRLKNIDSIMLSGSSSSSFIQKNIKQITNNDGLLDPSFNGSGMNAITGFIAGGGYSSPATTIGGGVDDQLNVITIQSDGKIVAAGFARGTDGLCHYALARFNRDGTLDSSFGISGSGAVSRIPGTVYIDSFIIEGGLCDQIGAIAIQSDGAIIVGGLSIDEFFNGHLSLARFTKEGALDTSFGQTSFGTEVYIPGTVYTTASSYSDTDGIQGMGITSDQKIVVGSYWSSTFLVAQFNSDGTLDSSFGVSGSHTYQPMTGAVALTDPIVSGGIVNQLNALYLQSDGYILTAGASNSFAQFAAFARFTPGGDLDTTFGVNSGTMQSTFAGTCYINGIISDGSADSVVSLVVGSDGTIYAGVNTSGGSNNYFAIAVLTRFGALVESFGKTGGGAVSNFGGTVWINGSIGDRPGLNILSVILLQNDGKIVLSGRCPSSDGDVNRFGIARFLGIDSASAGALDDAFGVTVAGQTQVTIPGTVYIPGSIAGGTGDNDLYGAALQIDPVHQTILVGGPVTYAPFSYYFGIAELTADGALNDSFGANTAGTQSTIMGTAFVDGVVNDVGNDYLMAQALQVDTKVLVAGSGTDSSNHTHWALGRFGTNGFLDATFGLNTLYTTSLIPGTEFFSQFIAGGTYDQIEAVIFQRNQYLIAGGVSNDAGGNSHFALGRFLTNGAVDPAFGVSNDQVTSPYPGVEYLTHFIAGGSSDQLMVLALQADGKLVAAGTSFDSGGNGYIALARFLQSGYLDSSFGTNGTTFISGCIAGGTHDTVGSLLINTDGSLIVVGTSNAHVCLAKFTASGILDNSFGATQGFVTSSIPGTVYINDFIAGGTSDTAEAAVLYRDGSIAVAITSQNAGAIPRYAVALFTDSGMLQSAFGGAQEGVQSLIPGTVFIVESIAGGISDTVKNVALQINGSLLLGGSSADLAGTTYYALVRLLSNGSLDQTFGANNQNVVSKFLGSCYIPISLIPGGTINQITALGILENDNFLTGGTVNESNGNTHFAAARFFNPITTSAYQQAYASVGATLYC